MSVDDIEEERQRIMEKLKRFVTETNKLGYYGTARRYQHALITLQNAAIPIMPRNKKL